MTAEQISLPFTALMIAFTVTCCDSCRPARRDAGIERDGPVASLDTMEADPRDAASEPVGPVVDPQSLGMESGDPSQPALDATLVLKSRKLVMTGDYEAAENALQAIIQQHPEHLEARHVLAGLQARTQRPDEAVATLSGLLASAFPLFDHRIEADPSTAVLREEYPEQYSGFEQVRRATAKAWEDALSSEGVFLLVAPAFAASGIGDPDSERLARGWVVFLSTRYDRFLPLTPGGNVAGFLLDRSRKWVYLVSWKTHVRALTDGDEVVRPALLNGVTVTYIDLTTLKQGPQVDLGDGVASVRLSARSGLLIVALERRDPGEGEPETSDLKVDWEHGDTEPTHEAAPGPMDLVVRHDDLAPPGASPGVEPMDADALPDGYSCVMAGEATRVCAVPTSKDSVLSSLVVEDLDSLPPRETVPVLEDVGILMMDVL